MVKPLTQASRAANMVNRGRAVSASTANTLTKDQRIAKFLFEDSDAAKGVRSVVKSIGDLFASPTISNLGVQNPTDVENAVNVALGFAGGSAIAPKPKNALNMGIKAYHGSPYDFDRFDMKKIGKGQGAQSFGRGLYFAEAEPTARSYRDTLSQSSFKFATGETAKNDIEAITKLTKKSALPQDGRRGLERTLQHGIKGIENSGNIDQAIEYMRGMSVDPVFGPTDPKVVADVERILRETAPEIKSLGRMYEVDIAADPSQLLDWDKQFKDQSPEIIKKLEEWVAKGGVRANAAREKQLAVANTGSRINRKTPEQLEKLSKVIDPNEWTGENIYKRMQIWSGKTDEDSASRAASGQLNEIGIPGLRYLDQLSRIVKSGDKPTHNIVTFRDDIIKIARKYGLTGAAAMAAADYLTGSGSGQGQAQAKGAP